MLIAPMYLKRSIICSKDYAGDISQPHWEAPAICLSNNSINQFKFLTKMTILCITLLFSIQWNDTPPPPLPPAFPMLKIEHAIKVFLHWVEEMCIPSLNSLSLHLLINIFVFLFLFFFPTRIKTFYLTHISINATPSSWCLHIKLISPTNRFNDIIGENGKTNIHAQKKKYAF
jgi:hypothetical protein